MLVIWFVCVGLHAHSEIHPYRIVCRGHFSTGALVSGAQAKSKIINTWTETHLQSSVHYRHSSATGIFRDTGGATSLARIIKDKDLKVYPNPFTGQLVIQLSAGQSLSSLILVNSSGKEVYRQTSLGGNRLQMNLSGLAKGVYIMRLRVGTQVLMRKLVKI